MSVEHLKSATVTNLDALNPVITNTAGEGAVGYLMQINGYATPSASASTGSTYQLVRIPVEAKVKHLIFESEAQSAGKFQLSVYYSDSTIDGTQVANQGVIVGGSPGGAAFFAGDIDCSSLVTPADYINGITNLGLYPLSLRNQPLWKALGLATNPYGFFDIVAVCHTTAVTTGTGKLGVSCQYVM